MKRTISLLLAVVMLCSFSSYASAEEQRETSIMPRYTHIAATLVDLSINETTNVSTNEAYFFSYDDTLELQIECKLQRYNNSKWNTVKTWTASGMGEAEVYKYWAVPSGYTYRDYVTFKVYDSNGNLVESVTRSDSYSFPAS